MGILLSTSTLVDDTIRLYVRNTPTTWQEVQLRWRLLSEGSQQKEAEPRDLRMVEFWQELTTGWAWKKHLPNFSPGTWFLVFHHGQSLRGDAENSMMLDEMGHAVMPFIIIEEISKHLEHVPKGHFTRPMTSYGLKSTSGSTLRCCGA